MGLRPRWLSWRPALPPCLFALTACGGGPSVPADAPDEQAADTGGPARAASGTDAMAAMGEVGALDRAEVDRTFGRATAAVDRCLAEGRQRAKPLHGAIAVFLRVDQNGRVATSELRRTTLGDRESAECIVEIYRKQQWPRPIGGKFGEIEHNHNFSVADADPPILWSAAQLRQAMAADPSGSADPAAPSAFDVLTEQLGRCQAEAGLSALEATFYLDEDGFVSTLGLGAGGPKQAAAHDCVATVLKTTSFPSPGHSPAKVTVTVP